MRMRPDADAAGDLAATDAIAELPGKHHGESLHTVAFGRM
jgi:hypothetical protein